MDYNNIENYEKPRLISRDIARIAKKVGIAFIILTVLFMVAGSYFYVTNKQVIDEALAEAMKNFEGFITAEGEIDTVMLIFNNIRVCFMAVLLGIIPFIYLPALLIPINAAVIAVVMVAISGTNPLNILLTLLLGILPHGILEMPAIFLAIGSGLWLCRVLSRKILGKDKEIKFGDELIKVLKVLFLVCIPLMIVAGIIETTITPMLLGRFFGV